MVLLCVLKWSIIIVMAFKYIEQNLKIKQNLNLKKIINF